MMKFSNTLACWEYGLIKRDLNVTFTCLFYFYVLCMISRVGPNIYLFNFSISFLFVPQVGEMLFHCFSLGVCVFFFSLFIGFSASGNCFPTKNLTLTQYLMGGLCMALAIRREGIVSKTPPQD